MIQAWYIYHKTSRSVPYVKILSPLFGSVLAIKATGIPSVRKQGCYLSKISWVSQKRTFGTWLKSSVSTLLRKEGFPLGFIASSYSWGSCTGCKTKTGVVGWRPLTTSKMLMSFEVFSMWPYRGQPYRRWKTTKSKPSARLLTQVSSKMSTSGPIGSQCS